MATDCGTRTMTFTVTLAPASAKTVTVRARTAGLTATTGEDFTAVDVRTGEVVWTRRAGAGTSFNNHYAAAYLGQDGDFYVGTINGIVVLRNGAQ